MTSDALRLSWVVKQLAPQVSSDAARRLGLGESLFSRLMRSGHPSVLLNTQYRMHPAIASFPSTMFYHGLLRDGVCAEQRPPPPSFPWPNRSAPIAFIGVGQQHMLLEETHGTSKANRCEAETIAQAVFAVLQAPAQNHGVKPGQVAIITAYAAQVPVIKAALRRCLGAPCANLLTVATVDSFQGMEYEVLLVSTVRASSGVASGTPLGFLSDSRRLNVLLTRARRGLILVGHAPTLVRDPTWARLLTHLAERCCVMGDGLDALPYTPAAAQADTSPAADESIQAAEMAAKVAAEAAKATRTCRESLEIADGFEARAADAKARPMARQSAVVSEAARAHAQRLARERAESEAATAKALTDEEPAAPALASSHAPPVHASCRGVIEEIEAEIGAEILHEGLKRPSSRKRPLCELAPASEQAQQPRASRIHD